MSKPSRSRSRSPAGPGGGVGQTVLAGGLTFHVPFVLQAAMVLQLRFTSVPYSHWRAGFAHAAGYRAVHAFSDLKIFEQQVGALLAEPGPVFVDLKIASSGPQERDYSRIHGPHVRKAFKDALMEDKAPPSA